MVLLVVLVDGQAAESALAVQVVVVLVQPLVV
jgi:hypothetical protein